MANSEWPLAAILIAGILGPSGCVATIFWSDNVAQKAKYEFQNRDCGKAQPKEPRDG